MVRRETSNSRAWSSQTGEEQINKTNKHTWQLHIKLRPSSTLLLTSPNLHRDHRPRGWGFLMRHIARSLTIPSQELLHPRGGGEVSCNQTTSFQPRRGVLPAFFCLYVCTCLNTSRGDAEMLTMCKLSPKLWLLSPKIDLMCGTSWITVTCWMSYVLA